MKQNIIYALIDKFTGELRYIGKSVSGICRPKEHFKPCNLKNNSYKTNWVRQHIAKGEKPEIVILESFEDPNSLFEAEMFWIAYYKGLGSRLTNLTDGGEGNIGWKPSNETIENQRKAALNRDKTPYQDPHNRKEHILIDGCEYRSCPSCKQNKPVNHFHKNSNRWQPYCKSCRNVVLKEWRKENPLPTLSDEEYNKSRLPGAIAGGKALMAKPGAKEAISKRMSKAVQGVHVVTGEIITFSSALEAKKAGFQNSNLGQAIRNNKPYKNYTWKFT